MLPKFSSFFAPLLGIFVLATVTRARKCAGLCRFKFCNPFPEQPASDSKTITLRAPGVAGFGPVICLSNFKDKMGFVLKTGEPIVINGPEVPMSQWKPPGHAPMFPKKYFRAKSIPVLGKSGIERIENKGNQWDFLAGICVKLPIVSYQMVKPKTGKVMKVIKTKGNRDDCVSFGTRLTKILIELTWEGKDDLDLKVTEPDGEVIDRFNRRSDSANLVADKGSEKCFTENKSGREVVLYRQDEPNVQPGEYSVDVLHFTKC